VKIIASVIGVPRVIKLDEGKLILDGNVSDLSVFSKEMF